MWLPINQILIVVVLGFIGYEVSNLYEHCKAPYLPAGSADAVVWDLQKMGALDIRILLAMNSAVPSMPLPTRDSPMGKGGYQFVGEFVGVQQAEALNVPDLEIRNLTLPRQFCNNGSVYLHVLAVTPSQQVLRHSAVKISRHVLQAGRKEPTRYLLTETAEEGLASAKAVSSLPRVIEVGFVQESQPMNGTKLSEKGLHQFIQGSEVKLPLFVNTLISPRDEYVPLLEAGSSAQTNKSGVGSEPLDLDVRFRNIGVGYWTLQMQIGLSFDEAEKMMQLNEYDVDSFKQMVGGSSPLKILAVYGIAILHLVFGYLAFTNDISFWRAKTSFEGFSSSSVAMQAVINIISFLYVREQNQTKFIMYFIAFRFCLQLWKLRKLTTLQRASSFPFVSWVNRGDVSSRLEELEDVADNERRCMGYLAVVLLPALIAFCIYRLIYHRFRSWYSWAVLSLSICAQAGGFVVMTPQVFLNHRMKSVAHLPWKVLTYQAINTFIDDVFALCIRMPEVQKYSAFRDDIVFIICCSQRWLYRKQPVKKESLPNDSSDKPSTAAVLGVHNANKANGITAANAGETPEKPQDSTSTASRMETPVRPTLKKENVTD